MKAIYIKPLAEFEPITEEQFICISHQNTTNLDGGTTQGPGVDTGGDNGENGGGFVGAKGGGFIWDDEF